MRLAAIDIGSNSVHMIVADSSGPHTFRVIERERERVKLGAGAFANGMLMPEPKAAALEALRNAGPPFLELGWGRDAIGMVLDESSDWDEVREVVTESYCVMAPRKLVALVERPDAPDERRDPGCP